MIKVTITQKPDGKGRIFAATGKSDKKATKK